MEYLDDIARMPSPSSSPLSELASRLDEISIPKDNKPTFFISSGSSEEDITRCPHPSHATTQQTNSSPSPDLHWIRRTPGVSRTLSSPRPCRTYRPSTPPELNFLVWNPSPSTYEPFVDSPALYPAKASPPLASDSDEDLPGLCSLKPSPPLTTHQKPPPHQSVFLRMLSSK